MLVAGFPADAFGTNCYVLAPAPGEQCVIVDPGIGVIDRLDAILAEHRLQPAAVLLTHGHLDHTFSVTPVCGARGVSAYVHPDDRELLADPAKALSMDLTELFGGRFSYAEPEDVVEMTDGSVLSLAGLELTVDHAPGHTRGSVLFRLPAAAQAEADELCLSGDVLFAGSIGRTDLPGGSIDQMLASLRDKILPLADNTMVLPGHGPSTTIGRERRANPYLRDLGAGGAVASPNRGW
ncbi:MBL fold metallo-hydrolase [Pilimelia columellifera]|uniref:MBL fold metallo-hydrolase n=1 Tax=Pilimelia columellifera subsp. columellifera TaxID=706583 RepID=A0ABN3NRP9_9ACTN